MRNINVPSYNSLLPKYRSIRSIVDLYDYISQWKQEVDEYIVHDTSDKSFKDTWPTNTTLDDFCAAVVADEDAVVGQVYLGQLGCSGLPEGMSNGEAEVKVTQGLNGKLLVIYMTSTNLSPYHWEQSYYNGTLYGWKSWVPAEALPDVRDYTSWNSAGTTEGGAGAIVVVDETGYKTILALTNSYTISNMPTGQEFYISANAVLDGNTLITVYNDTALTDDSGIKVKIGATRKSTIDEALSMVYYSSRNEANRYTDERRNEVYSKDDSCLVSAILSLSSAPGSGVRTILDNPEYRVLLTDKQGRILFGILQDGTRYQPMELATALEYVVESYTTDSVMNIVTISQQDYEALTIKDPNTEYNII